MSVNDVNMNMDVKKIFLSTLFIASSWIATCAQTSPPPAAMYISSNGGLSWTSLTGTGASTGAQFPPPPAALYYFDTGLNKWAPWTGAGGSGGGSIAHTPLVLKGDNAGNAVAATGVDEALTAALAGTTGNVFMGTTAPPNPGNNNVALGLSACSSLTFTPNTATTSAYENVCIGPFAGQRLTTSNFSVLIGSQAGFNLTGSGTPVEDTIVTAVGAGALQSMTSGGNSAAFGEDAGSGITTSNSDTIFGTHALTPLNGTTGNNVIVGANAEGTDGGTGYTIQRQVVIGQLADGLSSKSQSDDVIIGYQAAIAGTTMIKNVILGASSAPLATTENQAVVIGFDAGPSLVAGQNDVCVGFQACGSQVSAGGSVGIGGNANSDAGSDNVEIGGFTGGSSTQSDQVCVGLFACNNMSGGSNVAVGIQTSATGSGTGHNNVLLGRLAQVAANINSAAQIGVGTNSTSSTLQFLNTQIVNAAGFIPHANLDIVSNANTSATGGTGITSVTCATAACTNLRGTYTVVGGTATTGTIITLVWPTTTAVYACQVSQNDTGVATTYLGLGHSVATATGMTISAGITVIGTTFSVDYSCQP